MFPSTCNPVGYIAELCRC